MFCCFFNDTATTEIYTLSLHDALPILLCNNSVGMVESMMAVVALGAQAVLINTGLGPAQLETVAYDQGIKDRKSTRLNSSHANISYAVFCLKKNIQQHPLNVESHALPY